MTHLSGSMWLSAQKGLSGSLRRVVLDTPTQVAVPMHRWALPSRLAPEPDCATATSPAQMHDRRARRQAGLRGRRGGHLADHLGAGVGRRQLVDGNAEAVADLLVPGLGVGVEQEEDAGAVPVDGHLAGQLEEDVLLAVEQPAGALPQVGALLFEPEDLGHHVFGGGHVAGVLEQEGLHVVGEQAVGLRHAAHVEPAQHARHRAAVLVDRQQVEHLRRDAYPEDLGGSIAGLGEHLAGGGRDGAPRARRGLARPSRGAACRSRRAGRPTRRCGPRGRSGPPCRRRCPCRGPVCTSSPCALAFPRSAECSMTSKPQVNVES